MDTTFSKNLIDISDEKGFQFKFDCPNCDKTYTSTFKKSSAESLNKAVNIFGNLFGGRATRLANTADKIHQMMEGPQHDKALKDAELEILPKFIQCKKCNNWVCKENCWNSVQNECNSCISGNGESTQKDQTKSICPKCNATTKLNAKFCPECGQSLNKKIKCITCNEELESGQKFCSGCGERQGL